MRRSSLYQSARVPLAGCSESGCAMAGECAIAEPVTDGPRGRTVRYVAAGTGRARPPTTAERLVLCSAGVVSGAEVKEMAVLMVLLVGASVLFLFGGMMSLSQATLGVGSICVASV